MIKVKRIDHVAVAVADRDAAAHSLSTLFGLATGARETVAGQLTDVAFLHPAGAADTDAAVEICAPAGNAALTRFLANRGPGLHHVCFEVDDLSGALATLKAAGVRLIDETPRPGARGHQVAFLHPAATGGVLFELCERTHTGSSRVIRSPAAVTSPWSPPRRRWLLARAASAQMAPGGFGGPGGMQPPPPPGARAREGRRARRGGARGDPPERPRTAERLRRAGPPPHADLRAGRLPAPAHRLHAPVLPGAGLHDRPTDVPGDPATACRPSRRRSTAARPGPTGDPTRGVGNCGVEEHRRREHALPPRADAQRDRSGARALPDRRHRQHDHGIDARLARRHPGLQPPAVDRQPDRHARQRARGFRGDEPGSPGGRAERIRLQHPRQARLGGGGHRVRIDPLRPHALALGPRHLLQPGQLPRLRRRHDRRSRDGIDDDLRPPADGGLGSRRAGSDDAAADAGTQRSQRLSLRPVAERRRAAGRWGRSRASTAR